MPTKVTFVLTFNEVEDEIDITDFRLRMKKLLERFSDGIKCKSLKDLYQIHFGQQFPHEEFGFSCPEQLICELLDSFSIVKGNLFYFNLVLVILSQLFLPYNRTILHRKNLFASLF